MTSSRASRLKQLAIDRCKKQSVILFNTITVVFEHSYIEHTNNCLLPGGLANCSFDHLLAFLLPCLTTFDMAMVC